MDTNSKRWVENNCRFASEDQEPMSLEEIYSEGIPEENEAIWDSVGLSEFEKSLPIEWVDPSGLMAPLMGGSVLDAFKYHASDEQLKKVEEIRADMEKNGIIFPDHVIVLNGNTVLDGSHRVVAAAQAGLRLPAVNVMDLN